MAGNEFENGSESLIREVSQRRIDVVYWTSVVRELGFVRATIDTFTDNSPGWIADTRYPGFLSLCAIHTTQKRVSPSR